MSAPDLIAWTAVPAVPIGAASGFLLRRYVKGRFIARMRPHYVIGYAALGLACVHLAIVMGSMYGANITGIWLATLALAGLGAQALIGTNLQWARTSRALLRRWHTALFWIISALVAGHIALNYPVSR